MVKEEDDSYISYDAPPLDFSFKNIKHLSGSSHQTQNYQICNLGKVKKQFQWLKCIPK